LTIVDVSTNVDAIGGATISRVQLALNVTDLDTAVAFYAKLFDTEPAKRRPGYANFAIAEPPLKLVLIEGAAGRGPGVTGALNHLGVEVGTPEEVRAATHRLTDEGLAPTVQHATTCCYALQDKAWVSDPDGAPWEVYTVLADAPEETNLGCSTERCATVEEATIPVEVTVGGPAAGACC